MLDLIYAGIPFTRHDPLPLVSFPLRGTFPGDPIDWTPEVRLRAGQSIQRGSALYHVDHHSFYGDGLHPITSDQTPPPLRILGLSMLSVEALPWAPHYFPPGTLQREQGMVDWIRFTLQQERSALEKVGIYQAVFLSLFGYAWDLSFFQALAERWRFSSNTVVLEDRELTISPFEFQRVSGLPIFGDPYNEIGRAHV